MYAADDDSSTLLPASAGIERNAADKAESAARAAASRVTAWLQRSPTGPLARASCAGSASVPPSSDSASPDSARPDSASPGSVLAAADDASADESAAPAKGAGEDDTEASTPAPPAATTAD